MDQHVATKAEDHFWKCYYYVSDTAYFITDKRIISYPHLDKSDENQIWHYCYFKEEL